QALLLDPADQAVDLALVEQELARAGGVHVVTVPLRVGGDVQVVEEELGVAARTGEAVLEIGLAQAQGLDLRAFQDQPGLVELQELVEVPGLAVVGDDLYRHRLPPPPFYALPRARRG